MSCNSSDTLTVSPDTWRCMSSFCFSMESEMVLWQSCQQKHFTLLTCKAEYVTASEASQELVWLHHLLAGLDLHQLTFLPLLCNNNSAITLSSDPAFHTKLKYIDTLLLTLISFIFIFGSKNCWVPITVSFCPLCTPYLSFFSSYVSHIEEECWHTASLCTMHTDLSNSKLEFQ